MKREQRLGLVREILMSGGAALIAFGVIKESFDLVPAIGAIMAIISLIWVFRTKDSTPQVIVSLIRKAFSAAGGALVAYGCLNPEQSEAIGGLVFPLISLFSSAASNGDKPSPTGLPALIGLLAVCSLFSLPSCSLGLDPVTGMPVLKPDTETIIILSDKAAGRLNEEIAERIEDSSNE